ncbi:MAG: DUF4738 domain-containing protein [Prevotella bivia]|jgi:hypothetical protein|uniref:DUF4738 domain-containing protein n=1 Tax=Prevotella bivia TaxID=28125 RepID=UPI0025518241|nr:DUF4738 domain-containing protein [Prevotella bivia]MDU2113152.1 DUF4738 domain-containing protein [Prevotella bivia]MDU2329223.1 DUF4738 domain-containing protein [Prevotella bivia]MDU6554649.1 DUF4738 domain-containing protein [Prevotella bivia]MDU7314974.1 DUF4738 domain-containing protein [Prevotella bivia]WIL18735.1 DUF4738 domain-containing protein [Prevotella bivia]
MCKYFLLIVFVVLGFTACHRNVSSLDEQDVQAKQLLQGVWVDDEGTNPVILVCGDSIFFPDSASMPVKFWITRDSLYLQGKHLNSYKIVKQTPHFFAFQNQNGDELSVSKSGDKSLKKAFSYHVFAMNTFDEQNIDTIANTDLGYYRSLIHIETTSDKIIKSVYNDSGLEVDNLYLDNVASLVIKSRDVPVYVHDFRKAEFAAFIPKTFINDCILRKFYFTHADKHALYYEAVIGVPDAYTTYVVEVRIMPDGTVTKRLK